MYKMPKKMTFCLKRVLEINTQASDLIKRVKNSLARICLFG